MCRRFHQKFCGLDKDTHQITKPCKYHPLKTRNNDGIILAKFLPSEASAMLGCPKLEFRAAVGALCDPNDIIMSCVSRWLSTYVVIMVVGPILFLCWRRIDPHHVWCKPLLQSIQMKLTTSFLPSVVESGDAWLWLQFSPRVHVSLKRMRSESAPPSPGPVFYLLFWVK